MKAKRTAAEGSFVEEASEKICASVLQMPEIASAESIGIYISIDNEVRAEDLLDPLLADGKHVYAPVLVEDNIKFATLISLEGTRIEAGIRVPRLKTFVDADAIDAFIVPGVAFDPRGFRIGLGHSHYDKFFSKIPNSMKIGLAYNFQVVKKIENEPHDVSMDFIVTEKKILTCRK